jgi:hypothetical protein
MADNLIRTKQINQADLSGAVVNVIESNQYQLTYGGTGININDVGLITISGTDIYLLNSTLNVSGTGIFNALDLNNIDTLNLSGVSVTINAADVTLGNNLNVSGNLTVGGAVQYGLIAITGNLSGSTGTFTTFFANNLVYKTGSQNISGMKTFFDSGVFSLSGALASGLPNNPLSVVGSGNTYLQLNIQNRATGVTASADLVITANNGNDSSNFINLGINNVGYNDPLYNNATGLDGYLFIDGGDLNIGTRTAGKIIEFHAGGTTADKVIARIDASGMNMISGTYRVNNTGVLLSGQNSFVIQNSTTQANLNNANTMYYFMGHSAVYSSIRTDRAIPVLDSCVVKKASYTLNQASSSTLASGITGFIINSTKSLTGIIFTAPVSISDDNMNTYSNSNLNVPFSEGDNMVCAIYNTGALVTNIRSIVNIYCYN